MNALPLSRVVDRDGVEGRIIGMMASGPGDDRVVVVVFRREHQAAVPITALVEQSVAGGDQGYFLPLSLVELERHQRALSG